MATKNKISVGIDGRYKLVAHKADGSSRVVADWFSNLVLDSGLERLGTGGAIGRCVVGSDSTPPAVDQSALFALVASTTTLQSFLRGTAPDNSYVFYRKTFRFGMGVAAGNLSEVGVGWADTSLFSRALIRDDLGDPTTITILSDEVLDVIYEARMYPNLADQSFVLNIAGVDYTFTLRPVAITGTEGASASAYHYWHLNFADFLDSGYTAFNVSNFPKAMLGFGNGAALAGVTATSLTGPEIAEAWLTSSGSYSEFRTPYAPGSHERELRHTFDLNGGNVPFGGFMFLTRMGAYQCVVSPNIPKDNTKILKIDFTVSWARKV